MNERDTISTRVKSFNALAISNEYINIDKQKNLRTIERKRQSQMSGKLAEITGQYVLHNRNVTRKCTNIPKR